MATDRHGAPIDPGPRSWLHELALVVSSLVRPGPGIVWIDGHPYAQEETDVPA